LLDSARDLCIHHVPDSELLLADIHGGYGAIDSERNKLQETLDHFSKQYKYLMEAFDKGLWKRPDVREALALGGLAQGHAGLDQYDEAEGFYLRYIETWKDAPGEPTFYRSHYGTCLCFQGKLDEAETVLREEIDSREKQFGPQDTTSYR
jgi:tetratricopeptide (TPR) repeat protein